MEEVLANTFLPKLLGLESISGRLGKLLLLRANRAGLGISNLTEMADESHRTSLDCSKRLVESLVTGDALYSSEHRACAQRSSSNGKDIKKEMEEAHLDREKLSETNKG